jgi:hypothetical protein
MAATAGNAVMEPTFRGGLLSSPPAPLAGMGADEPCT